jgi:hypothetical protein
VLDVGQDQGRETEGIKGQNRSFVRDGPQQRKTHQYGGEERIEWRMLRAGTGWLNRGSGRFGVGTEDFCGGLCSVAAPLKNVCRAGDCPRTRGR